MKFKSFIVAVMLHTPLILLAQNFQQEVERGIQETENTKSGNFQDVIASFYQLALKNISQNENALEFNTTLFSIFKSYDDDILKTICRSGINFYRNFQVGGKINLNSQYKIDGYGASISYSIINSRNTEFVNLKGTNYHNLIDQFELLVWGAIGPTIASVKAKAPAALTDKDRLELSNELNRIATAVLSNEMKNVTTEPHYDIFIAELDTIIAANGIVDNAGNHIINAAGIIITASEAAKYVFEEKEEYYKSLENKPLLTFSADGNFGVAGKFNRGNLGGVFLVGNSVGELDARAKFSYADTLSTGLVRTNINAKLGYNFKVLKHTDGASYFEIKAYGEYNKILRNPLPDEEGETWLANAEIRIRLTDDLWLPFTIKYDVENANVLGFLNISYNFGDD